MQRAENVPDAFFRFTLGETSLFAVFAAESRSARFSGARNKSLHHAPHPAVVPVPYSHRHRRAKFWRPDSKSFCRFVPQPFRVIDKLAVGESHEVRTYTNFTSFRLSVCDAQKTEKRREFRDRMCTCITAHARLYDYHLVRAAPRTPANASRPAKNSAYRSPFPNSSNRKSRGPAPLAWVPIL